MNARRPELITGSNGDSLTSRQGADRANGSRRLRAVALPVEHGGWGFLFEPILLGLLVAPTWAGLCLGIAATAIFLVHQPLRIAAKDHRNGRRVPRTRWAEQFAAGYLLAAGIAFAAALALAHGPIWIPLLAALPFAAFQAIHDAEGHSRASSAEIAGTLALSATAAMIALAASWPIPAAVALWVLLAARAVASILYVRDRLRLERGKPHHRAVTLAAHIAAFALIAGLAAARLLPWGSAVIFVVLAARAAYGLSRFRRPLAPKFIGLQELGYGALLIVTTAVGLALQAGVPV
jgi:hypothetical protein